MFPVRDLVVLLGAIILLAEHVADDLEGLGSSILHHELLHLVLATLHHRVQALGSSTADVLSGRALLDKALDKLPDVALESLLLVGAGVLHHGVAGSVLGVQVLGGAGAQAALHGLSVGLGALLHRVLDSVLEAACALVLLGLVSLVPC